MRTIELISKEEISFAKRLKELMKEKGMSQEKLAESFTPPLSKNTITGWLKGTPLTRNKEERLKQLSDIFGVDTEYLDCNQATRRKPEFNYPELEKNLKSKDTDIFLALIQQLGFTYDFQEDGENTTAEFSQIESHKTIKGTIKFLCTYRISYSCECRLHIEGKGISISISEEEFEKLYEGILSYIRGSIANLADKWQKGF